MDHRHGLRTPISFSVRIYRRGSLLGTGVARNISRGGLFVELAEVPNGNESFVELEVMSMSARRLSARRLPGLIVHREPNGVGVMFADDS